MPVFSHSRISSYENCPLQYRLRYIDQVDVERRETVESFLGHRVHEALQFLYQRISEQVVPSLEELVTHLDSAWDRQWHARVLIVRAEMTADDYRQLARRYVTTYYRANHPFDQGHTVGTELAVIFELDAERDIQIRGYIDRLVRAAPGSYEIHDYKTSRRLPKRADLERDRQLGLYHIAVNHMVSDADHVRLVWHYLAHDRVFQDRRTPEALEQLRRETLAAILRIEEAAGLNHFPANRSRLCDWCEFRSMCPAWNPVQESLAFPEDRAPRRVAAAGGSLDASRRRG